MNPVKVYVTWDGDGIGSKVGRARLADDVGELRRLNQSIDAGNELFKLWVEAAGGNVVELGGDEGCVEVGSDRLSELPEIRRKYADRVGASCSVGIGVKLSESSQALMAAKITGKDCIRLFDDTVLQDLATLEQKPEGEKIYDEYLGKVDAEVDPRASGFHLPTEPEEPSTEQPQAEASERSPGETAQAQLDAAPAPEQTSSGRNFLNEFHDMAGSGDKQKQDEQKQGQEQENAAEGMKDLRSQVAQVIQDFRAQAPLVEALKTAEPELYRTLLDTMQSMIAMGRQLFSAPEPVQKSEDLMPGGKGDNAPDSDFDPEALATGVKTEMEEHGLDEARAKEVAKDHLTEDKNYYGLDKAALKAGKTGRHNVNLPVGSQVDPSASGTSDAGEIKIADPETGKTKWREVRSGVVMAPDGTATSARRPNG